VSSEVSGERRNGRPERIMTNLQEFRRIIMISMSKGGPVIANHQSRPPLQRSTPKWNPRDVAHSPDLGDVPLRGSGRGQELLRVVRNARRILFLAYAATGRRRHGWAFEPCINAVSAAQGSDGLTDTRIDTPATTRSVSRVMDTPSSPRLAPRTRTNRTTFNPVSFVTSPNPVPA
jgi:hypothetical protein